MRSAVAGRGPWHCGKAAEPPPDRRGRLVSAAECGAAAPFRIDRFASQRLMTGVA